MRIDDNGVLRDMTAEELAEYKESIRVPVDEQIAMLKQNLADTDYKAIKFAEGLISEEDYAETKAQRQLWRDEINRLESEVDTDGSN